MMKKFGNKFLASLAALVMAAGVSGCKKVKTPIDDKKTPEVTLSPELKAVVTAINATYQDEEGTNKGADFERYAVWTDEENRVFTIDWSLEILTEGAGDSIKIVKGKNKKGEDAENLVTIDVDEESEIDVNFKLSGVVHYGEESANLKTLSFVMPKLHIATWEEYADACKNGGSKKGDPKNKFYGVEGIVTTLIGTKNGNSTQAIYVQSEDNKGAFYGYGLDSDPADKVQVGQKVRLTGETAIYSGSYELVGCTIAKVLDESITTVAPVDYTAKYAAATDLKDANITAAQGLYVEIKDVTITGEDVSKGYYNFKKGNLESYVRISSSVCPIPKAAQDQLKTDHAAKSGWTADVKGIINLYDGNFYLTPIDAQPFNFKSLPALSDADAVAFEKERLTTSLEITKSGDVALPTAGGSYTDVAITWASSNATLAAIASDNSKVTYTLGESVEEVTLTATISRGDVSETKEFKVSVVGVIPWKTVAEVKELEKDIPNKTDSTKKYYVYGEITTDPTSDYCNFTLTSGDDDILVYGVWKDAENRYGTSRQISEIPFKKGDMFFCYANVQNYDGKWELTNALAMETPAPGSTVANPLDPAAAMAIINTLEDSKNSDDKYFVKAVIEDDVTADYANFHIGTGENSIKVYGVWKSFDPVQRFGSAREVHDIPFKKGDVITLKANLQKYVKDGVATPELTNAELISFYTPAAPFEVVHAGTAEDPYTIAEALFIGKGLSESKYNSTKKGNEYGEIKNCYVKGIVFDAGTYVEDKKAQNNMKLKDNAEGKELLVYTANFLDGEGNADPNGRVYLNDEVVVKGALMLYSGTVEISSVVTYEAELSDGKYVVKSTEYPNFASITRGKSAVTLGDHDGATVTGLPTEAVTNGSMVENIVVTPDSGKTIKNVKANGVALTPADGKYSFKVEGPMTLTVATEDEGGGNVVTTDVKMDFSGKTTSTNTKLEVQEDKGLAFLKGYLPSDKADLLTKVESTNIYDGNGSGGWLSGMNAKGTIKTGGGSATGTLKLTFAEGTKINKVVISCHAWNATNATDKVVVNDSAEQAATKDADNFGDLTFELDDATNVITIVGKNRVFIQSITFSIAAE